MFPDRRLKGGAARAIQAPAACDEQLQRPLLEHQPDDMFVIRLSQRDIRPMQVLFNPTGQIKPSKNLVNCIEPSVICWDN
jgi:hypothetical protein